MTILGLQHRQDVLVHVTADVKSAERGLTSLAKTTAGTAAAAKQLGDVQETTFKRIAAGAAQAGLSFKELNNKLTEIGKGQAALALQKGIQGISGELKSMLGIDVMGPGTSLGFLLGGPAGAAAGTLIETLGKGLGGALDSIFNKELDVSLARSNAYIKAMGELDSLIDLQNQYGDALKRVQAAAYQADATRGGADRAFGSYLGRYQGARDRVASLQVAVGEATDLRGGSSFVSRHEVELRRELRDAQVELTAATSAHGPAVIAARLANLHQADSLADLKAALKSGTIDTREYTQGLASLGMAAKAAANDVSGVARYVRSGGTDNGDGIGSLNGGRFAQSASSMLGDSSLGFAASAGPEADTAAATVIARNMELTAKWQEQLASYRDQPSVTEQMFGSVTEINGYHEAFSALTSTATSAYDAIVDGEGSATDAAKKALGSAIKGMGARMLVRSLEEGAEGIAALTNPLTAPTAAGHFIAAGKFLAGAAIAGGIASQFGSGGSSSGGSSGGAASAPNVRSYASSGGSGSSSAPREPVRIIVYADAFAEDSERGKRATAEKIVARALGSGVVENS